MKIAVIDDERPARKELIHQILTILPDSQIEEAESGGAALLLFSQHSFDLLFLDINLNDMEGTTLAAAAKRMLPKARIVFATAYSQYAVKAFELEVDNYILKPFDPDRVRQVLLKCQKDSKPSLFSSNHLAIHVNRTIILLDISQIVYIETCLRHCILHTVSKDYTENQLLGEYEKRLTSHSFYRIHKSFLVNLNYIEEMFPWCNNSMGIKMQGFDKNILPVGREKVKPLRDLIGI